MTTPQKCFDLSALAEELDKERAAGRTIAFANGLFDILHVGHLRYLQGAAAEADRLVVAINSDRSARELKGPTRPIMPEAERAELIAGFGCVDYVTIFSERDVRPLLRTLRPNVHCKGSDYTVDTVPEADVAGELGIRIAIVGDAKQHATTSIIEQIRDRSS